MLLQQSSLASYLERLPSSRRKALFIFFPNFEERSVTAAKIASSYPNIGAYSHAMVCWLQGSRPTEILDEIKLENTERVIEMCRSNWPELDEIQLAYPVPHIQVFQAPVRERIAGLAPIADIIVDISATPRDLLFQLFEVLFPVNSEKPFQIGNTIVGSIYFIYTWAKNYPISAGPELLGDLVGYHYRKPLPDLLRGKDRVRMAVCGAGTGHDALQAVTVADRIVTKTKLTSDVFLLLNRKNCLRSFDQMMRHQSLIKHVQSRGLRFNTVFSVEHFSSELTKIARLAAKEHQDGNSIFVVGPFGPKPLGLCAYFAAREYLRISNKHGANSNAVDLLDLDGAQYLTIYSIGAGETELYEVSTSPTEM